VREPVKVLLVTMYFLPTAGGGAQRALKFATYLPELGIETHVLTPQESKWLQRDETVPLPANVKVHRTRNPGPATRLRGRELHGRGRAARIAVEARLLPRRVLVPDASVFWALASIPAAARLVKNEGIDFVLTTSPPDSLHLLGAVVQRATAARWVADLRESIAFSPFRRREVRGERLLAGLVARRADGVVAVADGIAAEVRELGRAHALEVIRNGCDFDDFDGLHYERGPLFRITHTGSFLDRRDPRAFLEALAGTRGDVVARFVGDLRPADWEYARALGIADRVEALPFVPRRQALALQRDSEALLLLVDDAEGRGRTVLTGKVFEYLAAGRPILAAAPLDGEAAALIRETGAGTVVAPDDVDGIRLALRELEQRWREGVLEPRPLSPERRAKLSRRFGAEQLAAFLRTLYARR
jgi:glycosyltransferase involved in cell wall biosynthesis